MTEPAGVPPTEPPTHPSPSHGSAPDSSGGRGWSRGFLVALALIGVVALGVRVAYIVIAKSDADACGQVVCGDAYYYGLQAEVLADGGGFERPFTGGAAADHPPLTALVATPAAMLPGDNVRAQRLTMALIGTAAVLMIGLLGREVVGDRVGLIAAGLAAVYPNLWMNDGVVMSESLTALGMATALWLTYRLIGRPTIAAAAWLGAAIGLTVLARAELAMYLPLVVVPVVWFRTDLEARARLGRIAVAGLAALVMLAPWSLYNAARFERPVLVSTNDGLTLIGSNCDSVFSGPLVGLWNGFCADDVPADGDQSEVSAAYRSAALSYVGDHLDRLPTVVAARVGRVWGVYKPTQMATYSVGEGRERTLSLIGGWVYYPLTLAAVAGAVLLWRERRPVWPLLAPFAMVTVTAMLLYGLTRFRVPAEVAIVVLAAVLVDRVLPATRAPSGSG
ncbi:MAG: glycosyltransferase family 39 protein [Microthrixaceae bacterium]